MEHRKRQTREGTHTSGTDAPCGAESVPGAQEEWSVLLRAKEHGQTWRLVRGAVPRQQASLALLPGPSALVPEDRYLVGHQREEGRDQARSEEHTSELQSPCNLVCRLLLEKKKKKK